MFYLKETYRLVYGQTMGLTHRPTHRQKLRPTHRQKLEKGNFVTVKIPIVGGASGDLPRVLCRVDDIIGKDASLYKLSCEFGVLNACYDMGDIELLTRKVETSHWKKEESSLHAAAKQASFSLASKRCKCKGTCMNKYSNIGIVCQRK
jgi:hypothetical protein